MKYKAIFFDFDGTLSSFKTHSIPASALNAIQSAREKGIKIFLATGRHPMIFMQNDHASAVRFDAYLTSNGQYCYNDKEIIHRKFLHNADKQVLVELLEKNPIPILFLAQKEVYINLVDERVDAANKILRSMEAPILPAKHCLEQDIFSLLLYGGRQDEEYLLKHMPHCQAVRWHPTFTDVIPIDGGKDVGIDAMLDYYSIDLSETIAFGDAQNDMSMLKHVGLGIAMGNATEEVKLIADYVTDSVEDDGIYNALVKYAVI